MNFTASRQLLHSAAAFVSRVVRANPTRPSLGSIRAETRGDKLQLLASSGETSLETVIAVQEATNGTVLFPAKHFVQLLAGLDGENVTVSNMDEQGKDTNDVTLTSGGATVSLRSTPPEEFVKPGAVPEHKVDVDASLFATALAQTLPAASTDEARAALTGVHLSAVNDGLRVVTTDSYRLVIRDIPGISVLEEGQSVLVPASALSEVSRLGDVNGKVTLHFGDQEVVFEAGTNRLRTRLLQADYPDVTRLLPSGTPEHSITVNRQELTNASKLAGLMAPGASPVSFVFEDGSVTVKSNSADVGSVDKTIDATLVGEPVTLAFNHAYVSTALAAFPGDEVRFEANKPSQPVVIKDDTAPTLTYLIMPVRAGG